MSAGERYFAESNVLLYLTEIVDTARQSRAAEWVDPLWLPQAEGISWQVVHELY